MPKSRLRREEVMKAWWSMQGFDGPGEKTPRAVLAKRSWARALGGADPYFALIARGQGITAKKVASALRKGDIRVSPAVRGCMYVVARGEADLALSLAHHHSQKRNQRDLEKAGGTARQITKTAKAVLAALEDASLSTAQLRKGPVAKAIVKFGERGKKVGLTSSLPVALRQLEFDGAIERTPLNERLDTETYAWSLRQRPFARVPADEANQAIARLFFAQHGPASFEHFVAWSGLAKTAARAALEGLKLYEVEVEGHASTPSPMLATKAALDAASTRGKAKSEALLGLQDLYLVVRGGPSPVCAADHLDVEIPRWGPMRGGPIRETKHPHLRAVLVGGELRGFWDVNAAMDTQHIAWLQAPTKTAARRCDKAVTQLREFMATELGHAKTFSIDSDARIDQRFKLIQNLA